MTAGSKIYANTFYLSKGEIEEISLSVSKKWRMHHILTAHKVFELTQTMTRNF